jgi:hypothetical protein
MPYMAQRKLKSGIVCLEAAVIAGEIRMRAHLDQTADGALEFAGLGPVTVQLGGRAFGRHDQFDVVIVEDVDQPGETTRLIALLGPHPWHAGQKDGVKTVRQVKVIVL